MYCRRSILLPFSCFFFERLKGLNVSFLFIFNRRVSRLRKFKMEFDICHRRDTIVFVYLKEKKKHFVLSPKSFPRTSKQLLAPYFLSATCNIYFFFGHAAVPETFARNTRIRLLAFSTFDSTRRAHRVGPIIDSILLK